MKNLMLGLALVAIALNLVAAPATSSNGNSAGASVSAKRSIALATEVSSDPVVTRIEWFMGPQTNSPAFADFAKAINYYMLTGKSKPDSSMGYVLTPQSLTAPNVLWAAIHVKAVGGEKTSLASLKTKMSSPQDGGLYDPQTFEAVAYSPTAPGIRNGEYLESGPAAVEVDEFVVLVACKSYTASLAVVIDWIEAKNNNRFSVEVEVMVGSNPPVRSSVTTTGYNAEAPSLAIVSLGDNQVTIAITGNSALSYLLYWTEVLGGPLTYIRNVSGSATYTVPISGNTGFFGVKAQ